MYWKTRTVGDLEADLVAVEAKISQLRCEQHVLVNELDKAQAPQTDASRSMIEWVQAHLDVKTDTARDLVFAARRFKWNRDLYDRMVDGGATFDRTVAVVRLADAGATHGEVQESYRRDLSGVARMIARTRHVTPTVEREVFSDRFFTIQPNLDESRYRMWGEAPGIVGATIDKAICERADQLRDVAHGLPSSRGQRQLDALTAMALDSLAGISEEDDISDGESRSSDGGHVTVFVDARQDNSTETTGEIEYGPRVGPDVLDQMLCTGRVQIVGLDDQGVPVVVSRATRAIPPAIRHAVTRRDGVCVIDGCNSRYRLEPHHIQRFSDGGTHHPDNLATICWYHHHVAIHNNGYQIDPQSPPMRRRLTRASPTPGPEP